MLAMYTPAAEVNDFTRCTAAVHNSWAESSWKPSPQSPLCELALLPLFLPVHPVPVPASYVLGRMYKVMLELHQ